MANTPPNYKHKKIPAKKNPDFKKDEEVSKFVKNPDLDEEICKVNPNTERVEQNIHSHSYPDHDNIHKLIIDLRADVTTNSLRLDKIEDKPFDKQKTLHTQPPELHHVEIITNKYGIKDLIPILEMMQHLGVVGCTRDCNFEEYKEWKGKRLEWDGDGPSKIQSISSKKIQEGY